MKAGENSGANQRGLAGEIVNNYTNWKLGGKG